ncbi:MAG: hypothetical protein WB677_27805 [Xanthobacteraceae bacterium]
MIPRAELLLLINGIDRSANLDAIENLLERGLVSAVTNGDAITAIKTTTKGDSALSAMTLPATTA